MQTHENHSEKAYFDGLTEISLARVLTDNALLVKSRALKFLCDGCELEDLIQEGNIGLMSAAKRFDGSIAAFSTFARRCIDSAIIDYLRRGVKLSGIPKELLVDIDDVQVVDVKENPEHQVAVKEEYDKVIKKAEEVLSPKEFIVFKGLLAGLTHAEISKSNDMDIKAVDNAVQRIRGKLK